MLSHKGTCEIETGRLLLRRFSEEDAPAMNRVWGDGEVTKYLYVQTQRTVEQTQAFLKASIESYARKDRYFWAIALKDTGHAIGSFWVNCDDRDLRAELAYSLGREWWGKGIVSEAAESVMHFLFFDVGFQRVEASHSVSNPGSGRVMQKIGLRYEGTMRHKYICSAGVQDSAMYGAVKEDLYPSRCTGGFLFDLPELGDGVLKLGRPELQAADREKGRLPTYRFPLRDEKGEAGILRVSIGMSDVMYFAGNIGYLVNEDHRGQGIAARACRLAAPVLRAHGMGKALINCAPDNIPSRRTCEKLGARLIRVADVPEGTAQYEAGRHRVCVYEWSVPEDI